MFELLVLVNLLLVCQAKTTPESPEDNLTDEDFGTNLVASMRNDANLDLTADEEYEDLRAELLAYHTALASFSSDSKRRSLSSTPCWSLGGICVDNKLCTGFRYLTEVPGCKDRHRVCCFAWNQYRVKDFRDKGINNIAFPWTLQREFGGLGVIDADGKQKKTKKKTKRKPLKLNLHKDKEDEETDNDKIDVIEISDQENIGRSRLKKSNNTEIIALVIKSNK